MHIYFLFSTEHPIIQAKCTPPPAPPPAAAPAAPTAAAAPTAPTATAGLCTAATAPIHHNTAAATAG